ncbi:RnfH family protein [Parasalinivibrio latis]|uniref:RnfH family protein n=1 Tax=Parasalinivibrio latis TaxID=2952610 RepID=UPI0030E174FC
MATESLLRHIEVVYALPKEQRVFRLTVAAGTTVQACIDQSGILEAYPAIDLKVNKVGVYSRLAKLDSEVRDGDRIEIYRPLVADPKEIRRRRAEKAKMDGKADPVTGGKTNPLRREEEQ